MRQTADQIGSATGRHFLILVEITLLLGGLLVKMVTLPRGATHQLARARQFEALSD